jgi:LuxR family maltose regulon positive regulatory protein
LARCSVLDRLSGPLCDAVLDRRQSGEALRRVAHTNLFIVPLEDDGGWYRFHPLFAQLMRVQLGRLDPGVEVELKRRAYRWHHEHGNTAEAIGYAIDAGLFVEASGMIATSWIHWINAGMCSTVLRWIRRFPDATLTCDVRLLLAQAWSQSMSRRREQAGATIARIEELVGADTGPLPDGFSSATASLATLQGIFSWGDFDLGYTQALRATELEGPGSPWRPVVCWAMGLNLLFRGELVRADRWFVEATELAPANGQWLVASAGLAYRSLIAGQSGRVELQAQLAEQAAEIERDRGLQDIAAGPPLGVGASLAARGRPVEALPVLEHAVALARFGGQPGVLRWALGSYASVLCGLGEHEQARAALAEARPIINSGWASKSHSLCQGCLASGETDLTQRERTVLSFLTSDLSESEIARELFVSHSTVHSHTKSIYRKLGVSTRTEALDRARVLLIM